MTVLIPRNTTLSTTKSQTFSASSNNQPPPGGDGISVAVIAVVSIGVVLMAAISMYIVRFVYTHRNGTRATSFVLSVPDAHTRTVNR